jgi:hypothetical protein
MNRFKVHQEKDFFPDPKPVEEDSPPRLKRPTGQIKRPKSAKKLFQPRPSSARPASASAALARGSDKKNNNKKKRKKKKQLRKTDSDALFLGYASESSASASSEGEEKEESVVDPWDLEAGLLQETKEESSEPERHSPPPQQTQQEQAERLERRRRAMAQGGQDALAPGAAHPEADQVALLLLEPWANTRGVKKFIVDHLQRRGISITDESKFGGKQARACALSFLLFWFVSVVEWKAPSPCAVSLFFYLSSVTFTPPLLP